MGAAETKRLRADVEGLRHNNPNLRELNYEGTQLGNDGANILAGGLRTNTNLRRIQLGGCGIGPEGLHIFVRALCEDRLVPSRLRKLELSTSSTPTAQGNPIGDRGAKSLAFLLISSESLHHLKVASCGIGDEGMSSLAKGLARNRSLKTLDLSGNSISDSGAEELGLALKVNKNLKGLMLWHNRIFHTGAEGLASGLASNKTLQWLGLGCNHIGDEGARALALALVSNGQTTRLVWLALGGNSITDSGAEHLAVALKLQHTTPASAPSAETDSLSEQIRHGKLRPMLDLGVTPSQVSLQASKDQARTYFSGVEDDIDGGSQAYCLPLQSLGLGGNRISCRGAAYLADGLRTNTNLLKLGLADNRISDNGASALAELVRCTDTLQTLTLSGNEIRDRGGTILVASLTQNTSLQALYLAGNPCGDSVINQCKEVIGRHNHTLQILDLHDTRMTSPAAASLLDTMRSGKVLHSLGSQPVAESSVQHKSLVPVSGNMLEVEERQQTDTTIIRLQKKANKFSSSAPSQRQTTLNVLGSLPEPEETAQTMVIRQSTEASKATQRRRGSISHYIKKKLSTRKKSKESSSLSYNVLNLDEAIQPEPKRKKNQASINVGGVEMHPLIEEEDGGNILGRGEDFPDAGAPDSTVESSMFSLRSPTLTEDDSQIQAKGFNFHQGASGPGNNDDDTTFPSFPGIPALHGEAWMSSTPHSVPTETRLEQGRSFRPEEMNDQETEDQPDSLNLDMFSTPASVLVSSGTLPTVSTTSSVTASDALPPTVVSSSFKSSQNATSPLVQVGAATTSVHPIISTAVSMVTADSSSSQVPTVQCARASQTTTSSAAPIPSTSSFTSAPPATSHTQQSVVKSSVPSSSNGIEAVPPNQSSTTSSAQLEEPPTLPTSLPPSLPAIARVVQQEPQLPSSEPVVSIKPTPSNGFSGTGGSVPTNSWNVVTIPDFTDSLPRAALQEDDVEQFMDLDAVPRTESLGSITRQRPKPPPHRRLPSKVSPSTSPFHAPGSGEPGPLSGTRLSSPGSRVTRIGGITASTVLEDRETQINGDTKSEKSEKSLHDLQELWVTALKKRLGVLKMGGFLHRSYDAVTSSSVSKSHDYTAAKLFRNDPKNSLLAPLPPSHTRVKLQLVPDEVGSDYINASYVGPPTAPKEFIVTQSPMVNTVGDFWRMVWECRVGVVVVLTLEEEGLVWWPEEGESQSHPLVVDREWEEDSLIVSNIGEQINSANPDLIVRSITVEGVADNEKDSVQIFHYTNWPEYGLVASERDTSSLVRHITRAKLAQKYTASPVLVVSKHGAGRAGCFCTVFLANKLLTTANKSLIPLQWKEESNIIDQVLRSLRHCRDGLVASQKQFEFCHRAAGELLWGRPESQVELDTWERVKKKGKKKWKIFGGGKKDKSKEDKKDSKVKGLKKKRGKADEAAFLSDFNSEFLVST